WIHEPYTTADVGGDHRVADRGQGDLQQAFLVVQLTGGRIQLCQQGIACFLRADTIVDVLDLSNEHGPGLSQVISRERNQRPEITAILTHQPSYRFVELQISLHELMPDTGVGRTWVWMGVVNPAGAKKLGFVVSKHTASGRVDVHDLAIRVVQQSTDTGSAHGAPEQGFVT